MTHSLKGTKPVPWEYLSKFKITDLDKFEYLIFLGMTVFKTSRYDQTHIQNVWLFQWNSFCFHAFAHMIIET